ncbi:MAG: TVP38/TMEM64 family protein [Aerococcus sp.]|nr:TVP38/TMEM64 family protein [Aerococcus sp.]
MPPNRQQQAANTENYRKKRWVLIGVVVVLLILYGVVPPLRNMMNHIIYMFTTGNFQAVHDFIGSYGAYAALISFLLMIMQSIIAPLPAFLITIANANLFGWWQGALLSWFSAMVAACLCFYLARILGRDLVVKITSEKGLNNIENFFDHYGTHTILIARLLPFMPFDIVSFAAGLMPMSVVEFVVATGIGQLPATVIYSYAGGKLTGGAQALVTGLLILFAVAILISVLRMLWQERHKHQQ